MKTNKFYLLPLLFAISLFFSACHSNQVQADYWDLTPEQRDSAQFLATHHYSIGYNFVVTEDSLPLYPTPELIPNSLSCDSLPQTEFSYLTSNIYKDDKIVVLQILLQPAQKNSAHSKFCIKVARDQQTLGWIDEDALLNSAIPDDSISYCIHFFSHSYVLFFFVILTLCLCIFIVRLKHSQHVPIVHFQDIDSFWPTLFCAITAFAATLYGSMQAFCPDVWTAYYFAPTLWPFGHDAILSLFLISVWLIPITGIAAFDDIMKQLRSIDAIIYLLGLACSWLLIYITFSQSVKIYVGFPLLLAYYTFAFRRYKSHHFAPYICGQCGKPIHQLGECPYCKAINK